LFVVEYVPDRSLQRGLTVVVVPAFAEEMNRSRRMVALQAQRLTAHGLRVVVFDFFGTGDSEGDFGDARWESWVEDLRRVVYWSRAGSGRIGLLAVRLGALVAMDARVVVAGDSRSVFWQPCTSGKAYLRQFLRLRVVEKLLNNKQPEAESVTTLLARLREGESLEIAGYELAAPLALAIESRTLDRVAPQVIPALHWLDLVAADGDPLSPGTTAIVDRWTGAGVPIEVEAVRGDPFWSLQEITVAPQLIEVTTRAFLSS
jgi:exosortase A-associated hydrolase 2